MAVNQLEDILSWVEKLNQTVHVSIRKNTLEDSHFWFYDEKTGEITNQNHSFFQIKGIQCVNDGIVVTEQPIIIQDEIGYLGMICHEFDGVMHFLIQAKIEPGNINKIQLSPTIQATKSNFMQRHGGKRPAYLEYFMSASRYKIIVDQLQSEQSSRFYKKRNRNIIIEVEEDVPLYPSYKWMTLGQLKELMRWDNLVNMDTRTVISCLPFVYMDDRKLNSFLPVEELTDEALFRSMRNKKRIYGSIPYLYQYINNCKMFKKIECRLVPLYSLKRWHMRNGEFVCEDPYSFKMIFCDIEIEGREVQHWTQPLFEATGIATFALFTCVDNGIRKFLIQAKEEIGCFDQIELGPTIQREYGNSKNISIIDQIFDRHMDNKMGICFDGLLSEEGGRFYCEQNRNLIIEIDEAEICELPSGYFWLDYYTLNSLISVNSTLNIQLRNLLAILNW